MAARLSLTSKIVHRQLPFNPLGVTYRVSCPQPSRPKRHAIFCGPPRFDQNPIDLTQFPKWLTCEPKVMQGLYILCKNYAPLIKLHLICGALYAFWKTVSSFRKDQLIADPGKDKSDDQQALGAAIAYIKVLEDKIKKLEDEISQIKSLD